MTNISNTPDRRELMAFRAGGQDFCVDIQAVREIRGWTPATPLPKAPAYLQGVINLRGAILPIIDLSARLGLGATHASGRHVIMVVQVGDRTMGLLVEAVSEIIVVSADDVQPAPDMAGDASRTLILGIISLDHRLLSLLDVALLLPEVELAAA